MYNKRRANPSQSDTTNPNKRIQTDFYNAEPWKLVFNDGKQAFTNGQFKEAVSLFTRALDLNPNEITLLDYRAACFEKLNNTKSAIEDAGRIVKILPTDARGYLRGGKLFCLQKQYAKAIKLYTHGLRKVDPKDPKYTMLVDMKAKAEKATQPRPSMDIMTMLPYDVIGSIFSYLTFDRRVQCLAVSKKWREFGLRWSGMWRNLEFGNRRVTQNVIKRYLLCAQGRHVRSFCIHNAARNATNNILQSLIDENCQYIETLDFKGCDIYITPLARMLRLVGKNIKHLRLDDTTLTTTEILEVVIPMCPKLTHLSILNLTKGRDYSKSEFALIPNLSFIRCNELGMDIIRHSRQLQTIDFYSDAMYFTHFYDRIAPTHKSLETLHYSYGHKVEKIAWSPHDTVMTPSVKSKGIINFGIYDERFFNAHVMKVLFTINPLIEELTILGCDPSIGTEFPKFIGDIGLPQLSKLQIQNVTTLNAIGLHVIVTNCPLLEQVYFPGLPDVNDYILTEFANTASELKVLDISNCNRVTGVGLQALVRIHHSHLRKLVLNNCSRISVDAIIWARTQVARGVIESRYH
ncbi:hypothetical protein EDC94DRAFT_625133 [Helicostylum pulchrum]|nr:hypothetical protein EDC94DRAFT_625133 [Helicostylum pulchrum]